MTAQLSKTTRAEQVRRRRLQQSRRRFDAVSRTGGPLRAGPLVSRPRASAAPVRPVGRGPGRRSGLGAWLAALPLPALPRLSFGWRQASLVMVVLLAGMLVRLLADPAMYVDGVNLGGAALVPGQEIYARSGIAGQHIFWVDPEEVQRNVAEVPGIASVQVSVEWPNIVTILVTERIPVVTWIENEEHYWVDADGEKFKARGDLPGLLPLMLDDAPGRPGLHAATEERVPPEAVAGALQLRELRPNIELLHYDAQRGLSYADGRGWRGYFGVGTDMPQKLAVYERLVEDLLAKGIQPRLISVERPLAPYYQILETEAAP
jgi:hypothetical protein